MMIAGYAALFDVIDDGGDIIRPGAFSLKPGPAFAKRFALDWIARARANYTRPQPLKLLNAHDTHNVIGHITHISEDTRGLRIISKLASGGTVAVGTGLSIAFRAKEYVKHSGCRELLGIELIEVSAVMRPMQKGARVIAVCANDNQAALMARFGEVRRG